MSKKSKTRRSEKRKAEKRARKEQQKARYKAYAEDGRNQKSKRFATKKKRNVSGVSHPHGKCGNVGCIKCSTTAILYEARVKRELDERKKIARS